MSPINPVNEKIARAREHTRALDQVLGAHALRTPHHILGSWTAEGYWSYRVQLAETVPIRARILAGEAVNHLRSALDHLVWQLALLTSPQPNSNTEFPVFLDAEKYAAERAKKLQWQKIGSLSPAARQFIDNEQPCNASEPREHPLWLLHRLANIDKHRQITVVGASTNSFFMDQALAQLGHPELTVIANQPLEEGIEVGQLRIAGVTDPSVYEQANVKFLIDFVLSDEEGLIPEPAVETLGQLAGYVEGLIERSQHFFPVYS